MKDEQESHSGERLNSIPLKQKVGEFFKHWGTLVGKFWRTLGQRVISVIRSSVLANWHFLFANWLLPSQRDWNIRTLSFLMITFQKDSF